MKEILLFILLILTIYLYQTTINNENRIVNLERKIIELQFDMAELKKELSIYKIRQVNWYGQYEKQKRATTNMLRE